MFYVIDFADVGDMLFPFLSIFAGRKTEVRVFGKYTKHPDFEAAIVGSGVLELPQSRLSDASHIKYIVVRADKGNAVYLGDRLAPGFLLEAKNYDTLPKKYQVSNDFLAGDGATKGAASTKEAVANS